MLKRYDISFKRGNVITQKMLETMYDFPIEITERLMCDYSDGIVSGMDITANKGALTVTGGIYKFGGKLYVLENDVTFPADDFSGDKAYVLSLNLNSEYTPEIERDTAEYITSNGIRLVCTLKNEFEHVHDDRFILCEFRSGPKMPTSCCDLRSPLFNITKCRYSAPKEYTFHPYVFSLIYKKLKMKTEKHPFDYVLMTEISREKVLTREIMAQYIAEAFGTEYNITDLLMNFVNAIDRLHLKITVSHEEKAARIEERSKSNSIILDCETPFTIK